MAGIKILKYCLTLPLIVRVVTQNLHTKEKTTIDSGVFQKLSSIYTTKSAWLLTIFIDVTPNRNLMNNISEDIHFLRGDLQRVYTRYVEVVDPKTPDITENATSVKDFIGILNFLNLEQRIFKICSPKLKIIIKKLWSHS